MSLEDDDTEGRSRKEEEEEEEGLPDVDELVEASFLDEKVTQGDEDDDEDDDDEEEEEENVFGGFGSKKRMGKYATEGTRLVARLKVLLVNEKIAPEVLPFERDVVDSLKNRIERQQTMIDDADDQSEAVIYQMDLDRIKYMLTDYLRVRLKKIQKYVFHITSSREFSARLSEAEFAFAKKYLDIVGDHFQKSALQHIPERYQNLKESESSIPIPDLNTFVFCEIEEDIGAVDIDDSTPTFSRGDTYIVRYGDVKEFIADRRARLS
eukprot:g100.t1